MKNRFDTEKEAQEALNAARAESLGWCPITQDRCRKECICYYEGTMRQGSAPGRFWFAHYPCCTNVLINGVVTVEQ